MLFGGLIGKAQNWWRGTPPTVSPAEDPPTLSLPAPPPPPPPPPTKDDVDAAKRKEVMRRKKVLASTADHIITLLSSLRLGEDVDTIPGAAADNEEMLSHMLGCDFHLLDEVIDEINTTDTHYLTGSPREQVELFWPIDIAMIAKHGVEDGVYKIARVHSIDAKKYRGKIQLVPKYCCRVLYGAIQANGRCWADQAVVGLMGEKWVEIQPRQVKSTYRTECIKGQGKDYHEQLSHNLEIAYAIALSEHYNWHVAFGDESGPRLLLPTDAKGALELFKDRRKLATQTRRAALRHWVQNHYRERQSEGLVYVRDHLRGATRFFWKELPCELMVSAFDLEKNEAFRKQAAEWRARRTHNQVRVRVRRKV